MYDQTMEFDLNAVADMVAAAARYSEALLKRAADTQPAYRDEYLSRLDGYFSYRTGESKVRGAGIGKGICLMQPFSCI
jgi:hypothetical protein